MSKFDFLTPDGYKPIREIRSELLDSKKWNGPSLTKNEIDEKLELFCFRDTNTLFIAKKNVYPKFLEFLREKKKNKFSRTDFYDYFFIGHPLYNEILFLSYVFEKEMSNQISIEEYRKLESEKLFHTDQLVAEDILSIDNDYVTLSHHTISEYFVSQDLLKREKPIEELRKLAIVEIPQTKERYFNSSWYGVASFLLDSKVTSELVNFFIRLANENKKIIDEQYSERLSHSNLDLLTSGQKKELFIQIYTNAKESGVWISEWAVTGLASLYSKIVAANILEKDLVNTPVSFQDIVKTANVVAIMGVLIEEKKFTDAETLNRWKDIFIKYTKQRTGNGVLQRRCLRALENFKSDKEVIDQTKDVFDFTVDGITDQLVQEAFLRLCYIIAPNYDTTIEYICKGIISSQACVHAWSALERITELNSILKFLEKLNKNEELFEKFFEKEDIYLERDGDKEESHFLQQIRKLPTIDQPQNFFDISANLIIKACSIHHYFCIIDKFFIPVILETSLASNPNFCEKLLGIDPDKKQNKDYFNLVKLLAVVTNENNYENISDNVRKLKPELLDKYVYNISSREIRDILIKKFGFPLLQTRDLEKEEATKKQKIIDDFNYKLTPSPGMYITDVFDYYLRNKEKIGELTVEQKERLLFLAYDDGIKRLDPREFTLEINKYGDSKSFSQSGQVQFYGDMIRVVQELNPKSLDSCKQHLIDFIPFTLSDDLATIEEIVKNINEEEISYLNEVYLDKNNDRRYLSPGSYISFISDMEENGCNLASPFSVLKSFIGDEKIRKDEQNYALETLELFINEENIDEKLAAFLKEIENGENEKLSDTANGILIKKYKNQNSIKKRFSKIKSLAEAVPPRPSGVAYSIGFPELEYIDKSYARPLIEIIDISLTDSFIELLSFANGFSKTNNSQAYVEYINEIVFAYFEKIASIDNYNELITLEKWLDKNDSIWWKYNFPKLQVLFLKEIRKKIDEKQSANDDFASLLRSTQEIQTDIDKRNFWAIVRKNNKKQIKDNLSFVELKIANELKLLKQNGKRTEDCSYLSLATDQGNDEKCSSCLGEILFANDKYINWNSHRYLHPDYFILETNRKDSAYQFCQFLYLLGIIGNPEEKSYCNGNCLFIEYTFIGKMVIEWLQKKFLEKNAKTFIIDSFNQTNSDHSKMEVRL